MSPAAAPLHGALHLLDLPEDVLAAMAARLPFSQRLCLSLQASPCLNLGGRCYRWLAPRAAAVEELCFAVATPEPVDPQHYCSLPVPSLLLSLCEVEAGGPALRKLAKLSVEWPEAVELDEALMAARPAFRGLRKLAFPAVGRLEVWSRLPLPSLTDFSLADGTLAGMASTPEARHAILAAPWLPPTLTQLLVVSRNRLTHASLDPLAQLGPSLEELNISESFLSTFPSQLSALTRLRILYLHNAFNRHVRIQPGDWQALAPLTRLAFLSISGNRLAALPPCVAAMSQLQALHVEENELEAGLPLGPMLSSLRELLLDWQAALDSPAALRAATRLSRLALSCHRAVDEGPGPGLTVRPAEAAEPLLAALASMPALRCVDDVFGEEDTVTAPVARVMWQLGRRCPRVELRTLSTTDIGWGMAELERRAAAGD
ncbi:hypothetical protein CHLNCDRAFT_140893 [Chlorella variabilis]|uniref:F-box domain-containing protein n=1 Tax=Chlorella variabilis TaxID=554065 RepID=E1Z6G5_CHLVA|nr:hypothetical protein CHLNCDRAFT_140893 [Chlorella variabilis]EFN58645.1 hypothetical protein CHLNCDRAFT_140893 [Chlorella variabilis]|eukprot:XP_005850747.1 hypothetical protein CHLNCDRAFT_140893 [Chlorella variabilis]